MRNKQNIAELHRAFRREPLRFFSAQLNFLRPPLRYVLFITTLLFFLSTQVLYAQYRKLDSLKTELQNHPQQDLKHLQLLLLIAEAQEWAVTKDGITTADKAIALAKKLNNQKELAAAYNMKARLVIYNQEIERSEKILDSAFAINFSINNRHGLADNYLVKGIIKNAEGVNDEFKIMLDSASMFIQSFNDLLLKGRIEYNYGMYFSLFNVDSSTYHYKKSIALLTQIADTAWLANNYTWIARNFINAAKPNMDSVKACVNKVRALLISGGYKDFYTLELVFIAQSLSGHSLHAQAIEYLNEVLPIANETNNILNQQYVCFNLAFAYHGFANYAQAINYYFKNLRICEKLKNEYGISATLNNIGVIYKDMKDYNKALNYLVRAKDIDIKLKNNYALVSGLQEIGDIYMRQNKIKDAYEIFQQCLKLSVEVKAENILAVSYGYLGDLYYQANKPDSAFYCFNKAAALNKKMGITYYYAKNLISISRTINGLPDYEITDMMRKAFNANEKYKKAIDYANEALAIVKETGELDIQRDACLLLSELYERENNTSDSYKYFKKYVELNDSIINTENTKTINELRMQYESEKQQQQIASLQKDNALHQSEINSQKTQRNILMGGCALVLVLMGFVVNGYIAKTKANKEIEKTYTHLQTSQQQLVQQGKLVALAKMTSDVAQRIKEPIGIIKTLSPQGQLLVREYETATDEEEKNNILKKIKEQLTEINSSGVLANDVVKDVLMQTRKQTAVP